MHRDVAARAVVEARRLPVADEHQREPAWPTKAAPLRGREDELGESIREIAPSLWVEVGLHESRAGVLDADAPRQPRPVPPLRGDYRQ